MGPLAAAREESQSLGHCSGSSADRSNLVVLCFLVAAVSQRCARLHAETDCHVCVDSVYCGRHRQLYRRLDFRLLHSPWNVGSAGSHLDLSRQLCADSRRHSSCKRAQCVLRAGIDLCCVVGLCQLVDHGTDAAVRSFSAECRRLCHRPEWIGGGCGQHRLHAARRSFSRSIFLSTCVPCRWTVARAGDHLRLPADSSSGAGRSCVRLASRLRHFQWIGGCDGPKRNTK